DTIRDFRAQVAAILNITPDHLDRHHTMERYVAAKARVLCNQQPQDWAVLNFGDPLVRGLAARAPGGVVFFSAQRRLDDGVFLWDGNIVVRRAGREEVLIPRQQVPLRGAHNTENVLCACGVCLALGLTFPPVRAALEKFRGVRHRLEEVRTLDGVLYVNDSKGTNPDSTIKALQSFSEPVVLIAGGRHKGGDLAPLARLVAERVAHVVLVGEAAPVMRDALVAAGCARVEMAPDFPRAVERARALARPGDVDLFCSLVKGFQEGRP
ncbi:MAG: Mur ligase family protein, partial [Syntrophomonadaceae bacterium]|nr:Mur ligase family protein [Syntrophomonadaceae bacterium]